MPAAQSFAGIVFQRKIIGKIYRCILNPYLANLAECMYGTVPVLKQFDKRWPGSGRSYIQAGLLIYSKIMQAGPTPIPAARNLTKELKIKLYLKH